MRYYNDDKSPEPLDKDWNLVFLHTRYVHLRFYPGLEILILSMILSGCPVVVTSLCYVAFQRIQEFLGALFQKKVRYLMPSKKKDPFLCEDGIEIPSLAITVSVLSLGKPRDAKW